MTDPRPFVFDSDTGADDCFALLAAAALAPERVALLLSTYGNYTLETTTANLRTAAALGGLTLPVLPGAAAPLPTAFPSPHTAPEGVRFTRYSADFPAGAPACVSDDWLAEAYAVLRANAPCDYVAIGPLTCLALLLRRYPDAASLLRRIVVMGGAVEGGNVTPYAEYNIYCDALAAEEVFASGRDILLVPIDVCGTAALTDDAAARLGMGDDRLARCVRHLIRIENDLSDSFGNPHGIIYDAVALLAYLRPALYTTRRTGIRVVTNGERYGQTAETPDRRNVEVAVGVDRDGYFDALRDCIMRLRARASQTE